MRLTFEKVPDGCRVLDARGNLVCHVTDAWPNDDHRNGVVSWDPLPRGEWKIHFATGALPLATVEAVLAGLPAAAPPA